MKMSELRDLMANIDKCKRTISELTAVQIKGNRHRLLIQDYMSSGSTAPVNIEDPEMVRLCHAAMVRVVTERYEHLKERLKKEVPDIDIHA